MMFFSHWAQVHQVSWTVSGGGLQLAIDRFLGLRSMNHQFCWICGVVFYLGVGPLPPVHFLVTSIYGGFWAMVSLNRGQCSHANGGQSWKAIDGEDAVGVAIFPMSKHASRSWTNSKLWLCEVFCTQGTSLPSVPKRYLEVTYNSP